MKARVIPYDELALEGDLPGVRGDEVRWAVGSERAETPILMPTGMDGSYSGRFFEADSSYRAYRCRWSAMLAPAPALSSATGVASCGYLRERAVLAGRGANGSQAWERELNHNSRPALHSRPGAGPLRPAAGQLPDYPPLLTMPGSDDHRRFTRRQLLRGAGGVVGAATLGGAAFLAVRLSRGSPSRVIRSRAVRAHGSVRVFHSRPDLRPPAVTVTGADAAVAPGHLFLGPGATKVSQAGPLILDRRGEPLWFKPLGPGLWEANFRAWSYRGDPVLAWWQGSVFSRWATGGVRP